MLRLIEDDLANLGIKRSFDNIKGSNLWPVVRKQGVLAHTTFEVTLIVLKSTHYDLCTKCEKINTFGL